MQRGNPRFDVSSEQGDVQQQVVIRQWLIRTLLRGAFGRSSDRMLKNVRDVLVEVAGAKGSPFPASALSEALGIAYPVSDAECDGYLKHGYQGRYTRLILSLTYPDREWKDAVFHEDHIFPKSEFESRKLRRLPKYEDGRPRYPDDRIERCTALVNLIPNLELLTDTENLEKNATPFDDWVKTRDHGFRKRHTIPDLSDLQLEEFERFFASRSVLLREKLKAAMADA
jgi:hypothetical protein